MQSEYIIATASWAPAHTTTRRLICRWWLYFICTERVPSHPPLVPSKYYMQHCICFVCVFVNVHIAYALLDYLYIFTENKYKLKQINKVRDSSYNVKLKYNRTLYCIASFVDLRRFFCVLLAANSFYFLKCSLVVYFDFFILSKCSTYFSNGKGILYVFCCCFV